MNELVPINERYLGTKEHEIEKFSTAKIQKIVYTQTIANIKKYSPRWWEVWSDWMNQEDNNDYKKVAFQEFNKLQMKVIPSQISLPDDSLASIGVVILPRRDEIMPVDVPEQNEHKPVVNIEISK